MEHGCFLKIPKKYSKFKIHARIRPTGVNREGQLCRGDCLGGNCPRGNYIGKNCPERDCPGRSYPGAIVLGGIVSGAIVRGGVIQRGNVLEPLTLTTLIQRVCFSSKQPLKLYWSENLTKSQNEQPVH